LDWRANAPDGAIVIKTIECSSLTSILRRQTFASTDAATFRDAESPDAKSARLWSLRRLTALAATFARSNSATRTPGSSLLAVHTSAAVLQSRYSRYEQLLWCALVQFSDHGLF